MMLSVGSILGQRETKIGSLVIIGYTYQGKRIARVKPVGKLNSKMIKQFSANP